ncbi:hypothetical protein Y032_0238g3298 [Ancylostoma ceylanicum]|nr:hypothetical protein Y032_0238g3298 [Ancylostoma ceylanicum]
MHVVCSISELVLRSKLLPQTTAMKMLVNDEKNLEQTNANKVESEKEIESAQQKVDVAPLPLSTDPSAVGTPPAVSFVNIAENGSDVLYGLQQVGLIQLCEILLILVVVG